jgi:hypothetical protein
MGHVFISYSRQDTQEVQTIAEQLEQSGLDVWIDRQDIKPGKTWRGQIVKAIDTADSFVLNLSPNSTASDNVRIELDLAAEAIDPFVLARAGYRWQRKRWCLVRMVQFYHSALLAS